MAKNNRLLKQMSHLEYEIEFNQSYQLVYQDKIEKMIQAKVEKTNQKHAVELKKLEIEALDNQSYLTLKTDHLIEKLEHRYYWKLRAVKHLNRNKDQSI